MRRIIVTGKAKSRVALMAVAALASLWLTACGTAPEISPSEQPLAQSTIELLARKGMDPKAPMYVRVFKEESELEVWKARDDGRFYHLKTYPICNWSGELGPKERQGDRQAPEGFYTVSPQQMKPDSQFYLAINVGYPNNYDRAHGRTGDALMVHGKCKSAGCYAMTDALAEEIYGLARESFRGGQQSFALHAFAFRMTDEKLARFQKHKWYSFWHTMKQGYDAFESTRIPPEIAVCERRYVVDVSMPEGTRLDANGPCPQFHRPQIAPFAPIPAEQRSPLAPGAPGLPVAPIIKPAQGQLASDYVVVPGPKTRDAALVAQQTALAAAQHAAEQSAWGYQGPYANPGQYQNPGPDQSYSNAQSGAPAGASALGYTNR